MSPDLLEVLSYLSVAVYVAVAFAAWRLHARLRSEQSRWLALTFSTLAFVVVLGIVTPDATADSSAVDKFLGDLAIMVLLLFPYCLYRFAAGFRRPPLVVEILTGALLAGLVVWTLLLPVLPQERDQFTAGMRAYLFVLLAYWTLLSVWVAWELLRGGVGQPGVAKRRMQLLSFGTLVLNVALLLAGLASDAGTGTRVTTTLLGWTSAGLFLVGFAPPGGLRHAWRQRDERRLRRAEADLMTATTPEEVANTIVPRVADLMGGHGAALLDHDGAPLASQGFSAEELRHVGQEAGEQKTGHRVVLPLSSGWLVLQASRYSPFFGEEELELLRSLGSFVDLALGRISLFEQELITRKELERTNEELTALVYGISHDLRSPIVTVIGYLELLATDAAGQLGPEAQHYLDRISFSARYMDSLIRDLLELSRIGRTQTDTEPVDLSAVVEDIASELRRTHAAARVTIGELPTVVMNAVRARQLFTNLMENAVRHGGKDDITLTVTAEPTLEQFVITVADDGAGIPEPYRERVFGIFERLDEQSASSSSGTGIGLTMCRKIVEQLGGSIWVDPAPGGTTFKIALPAAVPQQSNSDVEVQRQ